MIPGFSPALETADHRKGRFPGSHHQLALILSFPLPSNNNNNTETHDINKASTSHLGFLLPFIHPPIHHSSLCPFTHSFVHVFHECSLGSHGVLATHK